MEKSSTAVKGKPQNVCHISRLPPEILEHIIGYIFASAGSRTRRRTLPYLPIISKDWQVANRFLYRAPAKFARATEFDFAGLLETLYRKPSLGKFIDELYLAPPCSCPSPLYLECSAEVIF